MSSDYLFPRLSFMRGVASVANLGGSVLVNNSATSAEADAKAIASDWEMVGKDMAGALDEYAEHN